MGIDLSSILASKMGSSPGKPLYVGIAETIGTTYPPVQKGAATEYEGYDIDIVNSMADDVYAFIDEVTNEKATVTKEILGKDESNRYDVARYVYAENREYMAWMKENHPKMYAWKNGDVLKYTESVSPRINEKAYDTPYVQTSGTTTVIVPAKAALMVGQRYSLSGGAFKAQTGCSALVIPMPDTITGRVTLTYENMATDSAYGNLYGGATNDTFTDTLMPVTGSTTTNIIIADAATGNYVGITSAHNFVVTSVENTGADGEYDNAHLYVNGVEVPIEITTDPTIATQESTTIVETDGGGTPITAVSAKNRSRTIDGVVYIRSEDDDVEPTVIYTARSDERNREASITQDGVTYHRYPLGDLGANRKKLTPIFIYANEHGNGKDLTTNMSPAQGSGHEGVMPALIASRFMRDLASGEQANNPLYQYIRANCMVVMIPVANPYGFNYPHTEDTGGDGYTNSNGVNINRNYDTPGWDVMAEGSTMGAYPGSENETQYIMNSMMESGAKVAMSLHGFWGWSAQKCCLIQGQDPDGSDYNQESYWKVRNFLKENYGYNLYYYERTTENGEIVNRPCLNTPDITSKSPSYITQSGAYGGIVEFNEDDIRTSEVVIERNGFTTENAYAQMLNLLAMWLANIS